MMGFIFRAILIALGLALAPLFLPIQLLLVPVLLFDRAVEERGPFAEVH